MADAPPGNGAQIMSERRKSARLTSKRRNNERSKSPSTTAITKRRRLSNNAQKEGQSKLQSPSFDYYYFGGKSGMVRVNNRITEPCDRLKFALSTRKFYKISERIIEPTPMEMREIAPPILQTSNCTCSTYEYNSLDFPRCTSCKSRKKGVICRFKGVRYLLKEGDLIVAYCFPSSSTSMEDKYTCTLPSTWNVTLEKSHISDTMLSVAEVLYPLLVQERVRLMLFTNNIRIQRETDERAICDTCLTSLFSNTWMCRLCGREICDDCFDVIAEQTATPLALPPLELIPEYYSNSILEPDEAFSTRKRAFQACIGTENHSISQFNPVTRFDTKEMAAAIREMGFLLKKDPDRDIESLIDFHKRARNNVGTEERSSELSECESSELSVCGSSELSACESSELSACESSELSACESSELSACESSDVACHDCEEGLPDQDTTPMELTSVNEDQLSDDVFSSLWSKGEPFVVRGLLGKLKIKWTPAFFIKEYGKEECTIVDCKTDETTEMTVAHFFSQFGRPKAQNACWKLKDWPPSSDFKSTFPELFEDFCRAVPAPSYTLRNGAFNLASHFPATRVAPDLGPKMYNAFGTSDSTGTTGTTKLHMDAADAVNLMVHAESSPDKGEGGAIWDIFLADDSEKINTSLRQECQDSEFEDPIHQQAFYLDANGRRKLLDEAGVRGFRFHQRPGDAVFIPAGCAHQVLNLSDCIKVACDFVTPTSVRTCEKLTREFRKQNQGEAWKQDVLQLRSMLWAAWNSCRRLPIAQDILHIKPVDLE